MSTYVVAHAERFTTSHVITAVVLVLAAIAVAVMIYAELRTPYR